MKLSLVINGAEQHIDAAADMPLLWLLRDQLGMTGTKYGCGTGLCGACTVHLDGKPVRSCQAPVAALNGAHVVTIEGVRGKAAEAVRTAWRKLDVVQCGYCQSGQIMSAVALLAGNAQPTDAAIDAAMRGNVCRCATYHRIRAAIHVAAEMMKA
jgi:isoquinoline 1-oxidoreductase alpha subunit